MVAAPAEGGDSSRTPWRRGKRPGSRLVALAAQVPGYPTTEHVGHPVEGRPRLNSPANVGQASLAKGPRQ